MRVAEPISGSEWLTGLDHVMFVVGDLDRFAADWIRHGFVVGPCERHGAELGTANRLVMFSANYVEAVAIRDVTPISTLLQAELNKRGDALSTLVLGTTNLQMAVHSLTANGIVKPAIMHQSRRLADNREARFSIAQIPAEWTPGSRILLVEHHTPELIWPMDQRHPNNATGIAEVAIRVSNLLEGADRYGRVFQTAPVMADGSVTFDVGCVVRLIAAEERLGPSAITFRIGNQAKEASVSDPRMIGITTGAALSFV